MTSTNHASFVIEHRYEHSPKRVFAAWRDPQAKRAWFAEGEGWDIQSYELDFREGGAETSKFRFQKGVETFGEETWFGNDTLFNEIVENERIIFTYAMDRNGVRFSVSLATAEFKPAGAGTRLISVDGDVLLTIVADTCGRHDTLGGACSRESNTMRYALEKEHMHACRDSFLCGVTSWGEGLGKRDIPCNINFFMNVPVTPEGKLTFEDGISGPGRYVEMRAEMDVLALISNCPQLNNPCNAYNPTPVRVLIWEA